MKAKGTHEQATMSKDSHSSNTKAAVFTDSTVSQSSSNSPKNQRQCNECLTNSPKVLRKCLSCEGYFHQNCHNPESGQNSDENPVSSAIVKGKRKTSKLKVLRKRCPACEKEIKNQNLYHNVEELQIKLTIEQDRRDNLQREGVQLTSAIHDIIKAVKFLETGKIEEFYSDWPSRSISMSDSTIFGESGSN